MPTNRYFNEFRNKSEQKLLDTLLTECIAMHGIDCFYIPKTFVKKDEIFGEDVLLEYKNKFPIEMYMESTEEFTSNDNLISKFGLDIKQTFTLLVSKKRFDEEYNRNFQTGIRRTQFDDRLKRPEEGDLIFIPYLTRKLWEVMYVNQEYSNTYQLGDLYVWKISCELYRFTDEKIDTGIPEIDNINEKLEKELQIDQPNFSDNEKLEEKSTTILDFTEKNPFGEFNREN